jgi:hypothetical protein
VPDYIEVQDAAPVVRDDKEAIQHTKGERWDGEEVHRGDGFAVVIPVWRLHRHHCQSPWPFPDFFILEFAIPLQRRLERRISEACERSG